MLFVSRSYIRGDVSGVCTCTCIVGQDAPHSSAGAIGLGCVDFVSTLLNKSCQNKMTTITEFTPLPRPPCHQSVIGSVQTVSQRVSHLGSHSSFGQVSKVWVAVVLEPCRMGLPRTRMWHFSRATSQSPQRLFHRAACRTRRARRATTRNTHDRTSTALSACLATHSLTRCTHPLCPCRHAAVRS